MDLSTYRIHHPVLEHVPAQLWASNAVLETESGQLLFREGTRPQSMFYVLGGELRLVRNARNGQEITLQRCQRGFFAEGSLDVLAYHCDAVARVASSVLSFPVDEFKNALANEPAFHASWSGHLAREVRRLRAQCERLNLNSARDRVVHYIEAEGVHGTMTLNQPKKAWAAELGLSHESLYRTLRGLDDTGEIHIDGDTITLRKPGR